MPTLEKLAANGLVYTQWHTTALCSPTRSTLLTGRNHHLNGMAAITEGANGFPGAGGRMPDQAADGRADSPGRRLEHVLAREEPQRRRNRRRPRASRKLWPLQKGFDRFYGLPDTVPVPESVAANIRGRSYKILSNVEITDPNASGVIFAHGSRFGGHALFIKNRKLTYVYNFLGIRPEQRFVSKAANQPRQAHRGRGVHPGEQG
jgi:hypothetical protein